MPQVQAINPQTKRNNSFKEMLAADAVGASLALGTDYMLQNDMFKHSDRFLPFFKQHSDALAQAGMQDKGVDDFISFVKGKKVSNSSLLYAALKGAAVAGLLYVGYDLVKKTAAKDDEDFGSKTAAATTLGAIGGGLVNYFSQKSVLNSLNNLRETNQNLYITQLSNPLLRDGVNVNYRNLRHLNPMFVARQNVENLTTLIGNNKVTKGHIFHGALRGGAYIGAAYVLFKGLKALFNKKPKPQVHLIEISDDAPNETQMKKTQKAKASEMVIDV